jgi:hypothetical protein
VGLTAYLPDLRAQLRLFFAWLEGVVSAAILPLPVAAYSALFPPHGAKHA